MAEIKCPRCNATVVYDENSDVAVCQNCGTSINVGAQSYNTADVNAALTNAYALLQNRNFQNAHSLFSQIGQAFPENPYVYLGMLMSEMGVRYKEEMPNFPFPFDTNKNYEKLMAYADDALKNEINTYLNTIKDRCAKNDEIYASVMSDLNVGTPDAINSALSKLAMIPHWRDADELVIKCKNFLGIKDKKTPKAKNEKTPKEKKKASGLKTFFIIFAIVLILGGAIAAGFFFFLLPNMNYNDAVDLMNDGKYEEAILAFEKLDGYKESTANITECEYKLALELMEDGYYEAAITKLEGLNGYKSSGELIASMETENEYLAALKLMEDGNYLDAIAAFVELGDYEKSAKMITQCKHLQAEKYFELCDYTAALELYEQIPDYQNSPGRIKCCYYNLALEHIARSEYGEAMEDFKAADGYDNSEKLIREYTYEYALEYIYKGDHVTAYELLKGVPENKRAVRLLEDFAIIPQHIDYTYSNGSHTSFDNDITVDFNSNGMLSYFSSLYADGSTYKYYFYYNDSLQLETIEYDSDYSFIVYELEYDHENNLLSIETRDYENFNSTVNYTYDFHNKLLSEEYNSGDYGYVINYEYDSYGVLESASYANNYDDYTYTIEYSYNTDGLLIEKCTEYNHGSKTIVNYYYNEEGQITDTVESYIYDDLTDEYYTLYGYNEDGIMNKMISESHNYAFTYEYSDYMILYIPGLHDLDEYVDIGKLEY